MVWKDGRVGTDRLIRPDEPFGEQIFTPGMLPMQRTLAISYRPYADETISLACDGDAGNLCAYGCPRSVAYTVTVGRFHYSVGPSHSPQSAVGLRK